MLQAESLFGTRGQSMESSTGPPPLLLLRFEQVGLLRATSGAACGIASRTSCLWLDDRLVAVFTAHAVAALLVTFRERRGCSHSMRVLASQTGMQPWTSAFYSIIWRITLASWC